MELLDDLRRIPELIDKSPEQAIYILSEKMAVLRSPATVLGFPVAFNLIPVAGAAILFVLMLALLAHIRRIERLVRCGADITDEAWIALFDGRLANGLTVIALFLPAIASAAVSWHFASSGGWESLLRGIFIVASAALGWLSHSSLRTCRRLGQPLPF